MLVLMTLTLMQHHSGSAEANTSAFNYLDNKASNAIIKPATTLGYFFNMISTSKTCIRLDHLGMIFTLYYVSDSCVVVFERLLDEYFRRWCVQRMLPYGTDISY